MKFVDDDDDKAPEHTYVSPRPKWKGVLPPALIYRYTIGYRLSLIAIRITLRVLGLNSHWAMVALDIDEAPLPCTCCVHRSDS